MKKRIEPKETNHALEQAKAQMESILEMVRALDTNDDNAREDAMQVIQEDALSVEVRSDWHEPDQDSKPTEFQILLCTGGPAVRLIGDLTEHNEPDNVHMEYQDWGTPWTPYYPPTEKERDAMLTYAQQFYFGS